MAKGIKQLKKDADKFFSQYVRYRDGEFKRGEWLVECITCGAEKPLKQIQAGHFVSRKVNALRFDEMNVNAQCLTAESKIKMFNGKHKSINQLRVGDELWAFNESEHTMREKATVELVDSFIPDKLYEVEMEDGSKFWATGDHRVVANNKWVYIKDMLHDVSTYDILEL